MVLESQVYERVCDSDEEANGSGSVRPRQVGLALFGTGLMAFLGTMCLSITAQPMPAGESGKVTSLVAGAGPAMVHFSQIAHSELPVLPHAQGSHSHLGDLAFSKVPGKDMTAGLYHLEAGPALQYTYTYEEFKYIVEGEFHLTDGTGQKLVAKQGDLVHFPRGSKITFETPNNALGYFIGQRGADEAAVKVDAAVRDAIASNPAMVLFPQIKETIGQQPKLANVDGSHSFLGDFAFSMVPGKEMTAGLYLDEAGPALHYTYTYEEFKYILEGEFHLTDGTGQKVVARKGDLMHFPKGSQIKFETPELGFGLYCGQRRGGEA